MANLALILSEAAGETHVEPASFGIIDAVATTLTHQRSLQSATP